MDYSFIRLEETFEKAKQIKNSPVSSIIRNDIIQLLPNEKYKQITNTSFGISFDGDYTAFLINCDGKDLADITSKVDIFEFIDNKGINQIVITLDKLNVDFYKQSVHLKLVHTIGSDVYYSNPFTISNYEKHKTTRFDYRNNSEIKGIAYDKVNFYQSIRLQTWFTNFEDKTDISDYFQISNGNTISNRPLIRQLENYAIDFMTNFIYERMNLMLCHDVIYVGEYRMTNKTTLKSGKMDADSNTFKTDFSIYKNYDEKYIEVLPNPPVYNLILDSFYPSDGQVFDLDIAVPLTINGTFNNPIEFNTGFLKLKKSGISIASFGFSDIFISGNTFQVSLSGITFTNGFYNIEIDAGLFKSGVNLNDFFTWEFLIVQE